MNIHTTAFAASHARTWAMLALISLMAASSAACAQDASAAPREPSPIDARLWLDMQASGSLASKNKQTLNGPAMSRVYQKFLKQMGAKGADEAGASGESGSDGKDNAASDLMKSLSSTKP